MTESEKEVEVKIENRNTVQLVFKGEKGEFVLSIPLGSSLKEAVKATGYFLSALSKAFSEHEAKVKAQQETQDEQSNGHESEIRDS